MTIIDASALGTTRERQLQTLTIAVSYVVGSHQQCVAGTAILIRLAGHFGIVLKPRAIALTGQAIGMPFLSTGTYSTELLKRRGAIPSDSEHIDETWGASAFRSAGHMIAFDDVESMLLDPSFEQFGPWGMPNNVIAVTVDSSALEWRIALSDTAFVIYLPGADNGGWRDAYAAAYDGATAMVQQLAEHLAAGGSPHTHRVRLDLNGAIVR